MCLLGAMGCLTDGVAPDTDELASTSDPIQAGQLELGFPAIGELTIADGHFCTATLIAPSYVLSAAHCAGAGMVFNTGTSSANFVAHAVDQQITHPTLDLLLAHLSAPITGIAPIEFNDGALPPIGQICTAVGFGWHDVNGTNTLGTKRSATEQITGVNSSQIVVQMGSGIADHGDSGGPLLCNSRITSVVHNHTDGVWPQHVAENYTTIDPVWILSHTFTDLTLQNGWTNTVFGTRNAAVAYVAGSVHFRGAIANGTTGVAFTLPAGFRPAANVYVQVDLCNATKGRLFIPPSGVVSVVAENSEFFNAQCFTSLEGVSFALSTTGYTPLVLQNGWTSAPFATRNPAVTSASGIVRFEGAIASGTTGVAFTLPAAFRPATNVYLPVDLCFGTKGRLFIPPTGVVSIVAENGTFSNAQCFTSLDGASFALSGGFTPLALQNGWTNAPFSTSSAAIENLGGIVRFKGAIASGTTSAPFTLPAAFRPATNVLVPVDLCGAANGRLVILPSGAVTIEAEASAFAQAQCFMSLDGVWYPL